MGLLTAYAGRGLRNEGKRIGQLKERILTDVLVIGSGIAGGVAALILAEDPQVQVTVVTNAAEPWESNTFYAQGGIIGRGPEDSADLLAEDLLRAGCGYNNPQAVKILAEQGPRLLQKVLLDKLGIRFTGTRGDRPDYIREAAHSTTRILHIDDATGRAIEERIIEAIEQMPNIRLLTGHTAVDLLTLSHHARDPLLVYSAPTCVGAYVFDQQNSIVNTYLAKKTILATGGLGQIFLHTTNSSQARGDGLAMAHRAGARVINAEYVQFHPTSFYRSSTGVRRFLISEAVRGSGARLVDTAGEPFMDRYSPQWKDLAPRDVVARSIHQEMLETGRDYVYLDIRTYLSQARIKERFPTIYRHCLEEGVDITNDLIPVVPAAHYHCGGVWVDAEGRSSLNNLSVVGETACTGVHGANRLGGASLLEALTWAYRAAQEIGMDLRDQLPITADEIPFWDDTGDDPADPALIYQDISTIKRIMWNYVGLVRTTPRLSLAIEDLRDLQNAIDKFYQTSRLDDRLIGLRNSVQAALIVALAAWENKIGQGCHYRE